MSVPLENRNCKRTHLSCKIKLVLNELHLLKLTTGVEFSLTFVNKSEQSDGPTIATEARSIGFDQKILSTPESEKGPYVTTGLKPNYCKTWVIIDKASNDVISAINSLQNENSPIPVIASSVPLQDVSDTNCSGVGSDYDFKLQSWCVSNVNESQVLSGTSVKLEPDGDREADKLQSNMNNIFVSTNFTSGVKLDEEPQPDEAEDQDPFSRTSNILISDCVSLSFIKPENILIEHDGIYQCDYCQQEYSEFDKLQAHITAHLSENIEPRERPRFNMLIGTNDEHFHSDCGIQEQTFGAPDIHNSVRPVGFVDSRSCGVSAVAEFVDGSTYGQQNQESLVEATRAGYDASDKLVISYATSSNSVSTVMDTGDILLRCDHCQKQFLGLDRLRSHIMVHLNEGLATGAEDKSFTCAFCDKSFFRPEHRLQHIRTHAGEKPFSCKFCDRRFSQSSARNTHARTHTGEKPFTCDFCDKRFSRTDARNEHLRSHTGEKPFTCDFCGKNFAKSSVRNVHVRIHTGEKPFTCDFCGMRFSLSSARKLHVRTHTGEKPFTCEFCDKRFAQTRHRNEHVRTHTGEKPFSCEYCDRKFVRAHERDKHSRTHTGEKPFACDFCGKSFSRIDARNAHIRTHTGEKPFACDLCDKRFARADARNAHVRTHTGEKPFPCDFCDKRFNQIAHRKSHVRTHTGEKPFSCEYCDRKFVRAHELVQHIRTHTGEKPFACDFCGKSFSRIDRRNAHIRTHTGEKPFACDLCDKKFAQIGHRNAHVRTHKGEKHFKCNLCDKRFAERSTRDKHIRTHTGTPEILCPIKPSLSSSMKKK